MIAYGIWMLTMASIFYVGAGDPGTAAHDLPIVGLGLGAAMAIVYGVRQHRPERTRSWLMLGGALVLTAASRVAYSHLPGSAGSPKPHLWIIYGLDLGAFLLAVAGLLTLLYARGRRRILPIDTAILLLGAGLLAALVLAVPYAIAPGEYPLNVALRLGYVGRDLILLAVAIHVLAVLRWKLPAILLSLGTLGFVTSDAVFRLGLIHGVWLGGGAVEAGYLLMFLAWGAAALPVTMRTLSTTSDDAGGDPLRLSLVVISSLLPFSLLVAGSVTDGVLFAGQVWHQPVIAITSMIILILVLVRLVGVAVALRRQVAGERVLREGITAIAAATDAESVAAAVRSAIRGLLPSRAPFSLIITGDPSHRAHPVASGSRVEVDPATGEQTLSFPLAPAEPEPTRTPTGTASPRPVRAWSNDVLHRNDVPHTNAVPHTNDVPPTLVVRGDSAALATTRPRLDVLVAQAAVALERLRLNNELIRRTSEQYFRTLAQNAADIIVIVDDDDHVRYASPSADATFGAARLRGAWLPGLVDDAERPTARRLLAQTRLGDPLTDGTRPRADAQWDEPVPHSSLASWTMRRIDGRPVRIEASCRDLSADPSIGGVVVTLRDVTERHRLEQELAERASYDALTGLPNRLLFSEMVQEAVSASADSGELSAVFAIDLDNFTVINEVLGSDVGDAVLGEVARRLDAMVPDGLAARFGGDEFALLVSAPDAASADDLAAQMVADLREPIEINGEMITSATSVGVATSVHAHTAPELMSFAELSLFAAKRAGKGRWRRFEPSMRSALVEGVELYSSLERTLNQAMDSGAQSTDRVAGGLTLEYQPIVALASGRTAGFEALLRWEHPTRGRLTPDEFIEIAEESGLIVQVGDWVLATAIGEARLWERAMPDDPPYVGVNVSARQFRSADFVESVARRLAESGLPPSRLQLEITESLLLRDDDRTWHDLQRLRRLGVRVAIDDFGTGYSSLSYLRQVPLDVVKLDRLFVSSIATSQRQRELVEGIVGLTAVLGLDVVAEGIETEAERELAEIVGCAYGQGYFFARPVRDAMDWMALGSRDHEVSAGAGRRS